MFDVRVHDIAPKTSYFFAEKNQQHRNSSLYMYKYINWSFDEILYAETHIWIVYVSLVCDCEMLCMSVSVLSTNTHILWISLIRFFLAPTPSLHFYMYRTRYHGMVAAELLSLCHAKKIINSIWVCIGKSVYNFVTSVNLERARERYTICSQSAHTHTLMYMYIVHIYFCRFWQTVHIYCRRSLCSLILSSFFL